MIAIGASSSMITAMTIPPAATSATLALHSAADTAPNVGGHHGPFRVISADCHAVGRPDDFRPFIESQYLDAFDDENRKRIELARETRKASEDGGLLFSRGAGGVPVARGHRGSRPRRHRGPVGLRPSHPGARGRRRRRGGGVPERRPVRHRSWWRAGAARAAHRRTARVQPLARRLLRAGARPSRGDRAAADPRRRALDRRDRTSAAAGLKGVSVPLLFDDPGAPPLYHEQYEPMWAACAANRLPVHVHGGAGPDYGGGIDTLTRIMLYVTEVPLWPRRACSTSCSGTACSNATPTCSWCSPRAPATGCRRSSATSTTCTGRRTSRTSVRCCRCTERVLGAPVLRRVVVGVTRGDRHALRDRRRLHDVRLRLPTRRGHVAAHVRLGRRDARRDSRARATQDPRWERGTPLRLRPRPAGAHRGNASASRSPSSPSAARCRRSDTQVDRPGTMPRVLGPTLPAQHLLGSRFTPWGDEVDDSKLERWGAWRASRSWCSC